MLEKMYSWMISYMNWWVNFYATNPGVTKALIVVSILATVAAVGVLAVYVIPEFVKAIKAK